MSYKQFFTYITLVFGVLAAGTVVYYLKYSLEFDKPVVIYVCLNTGAAIVGLIGRFSGKR